MTDEIPEDFKQLYASITLPMTTDDEYQVAPKVYEACKVKWCVSAPSVAETEKAFSEAYLRASRNHYKHRAEQLAKKVVEFEADPRTTIDAAIAQSQPAPLTGKPVVPIGHFWRGEINRFYCKNCGAHHESHTHTDEASLCPDQEGGKQL